MTGDDHPLPRRDPAEGEEMSAPPEEFNLILVNAIPDFGCCCN
jgi:hypothetical protein